jgi:hypothetical protein
MFEVIAVLGIIVTIIHKLAPAEDPIRTEIPVNTGEDNKNNNN